MNDEHVSETELEAESEQSPVTLLDESVEAADDGHDDSLSTETEDLPVASMPVDAQLLRQIIEGALLAAGQPLTVARMLELFDEAVAPSKEEVLAALDEIADDNAARGFELKEVASGYRLQVRKELAPWVNRLWEEKPQKYSRALLETLALIAYRQPITRGDIEEIRGVAVSSHIMKTLMERDWVKVVGQRDVPGRPSLYATTRQFLDYFNLKSLDQLPSLSEIRDIDSLNADLNAELDLGDVPEAHAAEPEEVEQEISQLDEDEEETFENTSDSLFASDDETDGQDATAQLDTDEDYRSL